MFPRALFLVLCCFSCTKTTSPIASVTPALRTIKIFKAIDNVCEATLLQEDITNFEENSNKVNLILNAEKCTALRITRKHHKIEYPYTLHDAVLESTIHGERDLGLYTSTNLTWLKHVQGLLMCSINQTARLREESYLGSSYSVFDSTLQLTILVRIQIRVTINVSKRFHLPEVMNFSSGILEACPHCVHSLSHVIAGLWRLSM